MYVSCILFSSLLEWHSLLAVVLLWFSFTVTHPKQCCVVRINIVVSHLDQCLSSHGFCGAVQAINHAQVTHAPKASNNK